jgi:hypothetical protein
MTDISSIGTNAAAQPVVPQPQPAPTAPNDSGSDQSAAPAVAPSTYTALAAVSTSNIRGVDVDQTA